MNSADSTRTRGLSRTSMGTVCSCQKMQKRQISGKLPELHVLERIDGLSGRWSVVHTLYPLLQESGGEQVLLTVLYRIGFMTCLNIVFF